MLLEAAFAVALVRNPPAAPNKVHFDRELKALILTDAALRIGGDTTSTRWTLGHGTTEAMLPAAIVKTTPGLAAFETGIVAFEVVAARQLVKHHHPKLAKLGVMIDIGFVAPTVARNFYGDVKAAGKAKR